MYALSWSCVLMQGHGSKDLYRLIDLRAFKVDTIVYLSNTYYTFLWPFTANGMYFLNIKNISIIINHWNNSDWVGGYHFLIYLRGNPINRLVKFSKDPDNSFWSYNFEGLYHQSGLWHHMVTNIVTDFMSQIKKNNYFSLTLTVHNFFS